MSSFPLVKLVLLATITVGAASSNAQLISSQKISDVEGGFTGSLTDEGRFGEGLVSIGDLDLDGVADLAVSNDLDDDGGTGRGALWILFMNSDGTVDGHQKISDTAGGFTGVLDDGDRFGGLPTALGDLDGDLVNDLAVGAIGDDDGGTDRGAVWILFMNANGTVKSHQKISDTVGGFTGTLSDQDAFGSRPAGLGDLDGDTIPDVAVSATGDDDGGTDRGAVWILFMNANGTVKSHQKISDTMGGFTGVLDNSDRFSFSLGNVGDVDGDGVIDLGVGVIGDDDGGANRGALWILFLNIDGTVKTHQKISDTTGGFAGVLDDGDGFGSDVAFIDDRDANGVDDIVVAALTDDDGGPNRGALWILFLDSDGTVLKEQKISETTGGVSLGLDDNDRFGFGLSSVGDLDGNGAHDLAVGAILDDDGGLDRGAIRILFLKAAPSVPASGIFGLASLVSLLAGYATFALSKRAAGRINT